MKKFKMNKRNIIKHFEIIKNTFIFVPLNRTSIDTLVFIPLLYLSLRSYMLIFLFVNNLF